ncbi:MAG TPA: alkaline phosphatase family protein [Chloroflexota bacterium]
MLKRALVVAFLASLLPLSPALADVPSQASSGVPNFSHIVLIVMENRSEASIIGNPAAPFINSLAGSYASLDNYSAVSHPSLPNYLALAGGDTFGITSDCTSCDVPDRNIADLLAAAGISGMAYMEDLPRPCFSSPSSGRYAKKHNPFMYFDDVRNDPARCGSVVPFTQFATDLAANQLPQYAWITPNLCNDMHDCSVATGDQWLASNVSALLSSPAFAQQSSLLAVVWDEDDGSAANHVPLLLAGQQVKRGYVSHAPANHYSLLRTIEAAWKLPALTPNDTNAQPITDVFGGVDGSLVDGRR